MDKNRCVSAIALGLLILILPAHLFAQSNALPSISALEKEDLKLRAQEKALLHKLAASDNANLEEFPAKPSIDPQITELSTQTAKLVGRADSLNVRLDSANKDAEDILERAQLATKRIQDMQTSHSFMASESRAPATHDLQIAYVGSEQAPLLADPEQPEIVLATVLKGTPVFIEYLAQAQYRIVTSTGVRGWLSGNDLVFRPDEFHPASSLVRIKAIQPM
jgi:hypothetical protein